MEKTNSISALLSIDGYKAVAVLSLAAIGIYTAIKWWTSFVARL